MSTMIGMIGSLLRLIRGAAINAILDGTEKITKNTLAAVAADIASQNPRYGGLEQQRNGEWR